MSKWSKAKSEAKVPTITAAEVAKTTGKALKPRNAKPKRKPVWVYLTPKEQAAVESEAIKAEESVSEFIRNAVRRRVGNAV